MNITLLYRMTAIAMVYDDHVGTDWYYRDFDPNRTTASSAAANRRMVAQEAVSRYLSDGIDSLIGEGIEWNRIL